jgi:hypothetical protein
VDEAEQPAVDEAEQPAADEAEQPAADEEESSAATTSDPEDFHSVDPTSVGESGGSGPSLGGGGPGVTPSPVDTASVGDPPVLTDGAPDALAVETVWEDRGCLVHAFNRILHHHGEPSVTDAVIAPYLATITASAVAQGNGAAVFGVDNASGTLDAGEAVVSQVPSVHNDRNSGLTVIYLR